MTGGPVSHYFNFLWRE